MTGTPRLEYPFIAGSSDSSRSTATFDTVNPATEAVVGSFVQSDRRHVDDAVAAADSAQRRWAAMAASRRGDCIWQFGQLIREHADELAAIDTIEIGKPIADSSVDVPGAAPVCRYWAGMADKIWGHMLPVTPGHLSYTKRDPLGVIGVIVPWNAPVRSFVVRVVAAVACGNGVVVKPSEFSPTSSLRLAELTAAAGFPEGLINVVTGDGDVGAMLSSHPGIGGISFTGSVASGRAVNVAAAATFKKVVLELGGKSPNIVFADADLDAALHGSVWGVFYNSGQICGAGTRLLLQRSIADQFISRLREAATRIRVGDPMDRSMHIGPVVCRQQYDRVREYIEIGRHEATLELGGGRPTSLPDDRGFYVEPTIFVGANPSARIAREEVFGPVLTVLTFDDEEEALSLANNVDFGLGATVWTRDSGRLLRMAERVEAGTVWCNTMRLQDSSLPFGGYKNSGLGNASGDGAVEGNTKLRRVSIRYDDNAHAPGWDL